MSFDIAKYPTTAWSTPPGVTFYLPKESLPRKLCRRRLRRYLLDSVSRSSGHFASGLGTVELTVALHYVTTTPRFDQLIWDVGHEAYPHKKSLPVVASKIGTIRQKGGLHPFPWRGKRNTMLSVGHSSHLHQRRYRHCRGGGENGIAAHRRIVIGGGAITAGMAF